MYNSSYARPKFTLEAKDINKSKGKSCGYYLRIVFFFSSLIQSLIIVSLVLFLVYGQPEKTTEEKRVKELEQGYNKLTAEHIKLRKEKTDLTAALKTTTTEKDAADKKVAKLTADLDAAKENNTKMLQLLGICNASKPPVRSVLPCPPVSSTTGQMKTLQTLLDQQRSLYEILQSNFSHTVQNLKSERDTALKDKTKHEADAIKLKQEKDDLTSQLQLYTKKCKEDFVSSLQGIQDVTTAFLTKIENLLPDTFTFHLTCTKQQEQFEKIQVNCTNLSRQVENKFQNYLNSVGDKVSALQAQSSSLEIQNKRLNTEIQQCSQGRTQEIEQCRKLLQEAQHAQDRLFEPLLKTQKQLMQEKQFLQATCSQRPPMPKPSGLEGPIYGQQSRTGGSSPGAHTSVQSAGQPPKVK